MVLTIRNTEGIGGAADALRRRLRSREEGPTMMGTMDGNLRILSSHTPQTPMMSTGWMEDPLEECRVC